MRKHISIGFAFLFICLSTAQAKHGADDSSADRRQEDRRADSRQEGDRNGGSGNSSVTCRRPRESTVRYKLNPALGFETAKIASRLSIKSKKCKGGAAVIERFTGSVKLPIPTSSLGVTDSASAGSAELHYIFSRDGADYANCTFRFDADEDEDRLTNVSFPRAEYKLDLENRAKRGVASVRRKKGSCDIDLAAAGLQSGIPAVATGDAVRAEVVVNGSPVKFVEDVF